MSKSIDDIYREDIPDDDPDISYLKGKRLQAYRQGDFEYLGVRAVAKVTVNKRVHTLTSPGLWGIESDMDEDYLKEVFKDEIGFLKEDLLALGFTKTQVNKAVKDYT